jgi:hypothetical protein
MNWSFIGGGQPRVTKPNWFAAGKSAEGRETQRRFKILRETRPLARQTTRQYCLDSFYSWQNDRETHA